MQATDTTGPAGASGRMAVYALVRTQGRTIAIPSDCVTQAVEAPPELTQVPRRDGAVLGLITLGERVVPVIGLARWLKPAAGGDRTDRTDGALERTHGLVLLLRRGDTSVGLSIEAVVGVQRIRADKARRLFHDDSPDELFQSVALFGDDGVPTSILEPSRLFDLASVWVADAAFDGSPADRTSGSTPQVARSSTAAVTEPYAVFRIDDVRFALPARNVGELLRRPSLRQEFPLHDGVLGLCDWRGRVVPVVDLAGPLQALRSGEEAAWLCIVSEGDRAIGIVMHEVAEIAKVATDAGTPEHAPASARSVVARRLVADARLLQIIDVDALMRRYTETAISIKGAEDSQLRVAKDSAAPAYMVFDAGGLFAAPIDGVQEVVSMPDALRQRLDAGIATMLQWREQPVPVLPIADRLVALSVQAARQLIVVRHGERLCALAIDGVKGLVPPGAALRNRIRLQGRAVDIISVENEAHHASYPVVDLHAALQPVA